MAREVSELRAAVAAGPTKPEARPQMFGKASYEPCDDDLETALVEDASRVAVDEFDPALAMHGVEAVSMLEQLKALGSALADLADRESPETEDVIRATGFRGLDQGVA